MSKDQEKSTAADEQPHIVSTGWRMKDLSHEELKAAPDDVFEIYMQMKAGQAVDPQQLATAIREHRRYFIGPKARYQKRPRPKSFSDRFKESLRNGK
jgi:hypothetical protein